MSGLLAGERTLGLLDLTVKLSWCALIAGNVCASVLVKFDEVVDNSVVKVFLSQVCVTRGSQHPKDTIVNGQEGYIECTSTNIVNDDLGFTAFFVQTVCDGGSGGFVDNMKDMKICDSAGIFGGLIVETCKR
jgi:NAD-specific glutamate dehydrogenase